MLIDTGVILWNYMRRDVTKRYERNKGIPIIKLDTLMRVKGYKSKKLLVNNVIH